MNAAITAALAAGLVATLWLARQPATNAVPQACGARQELATGRGYLGTGRARHSRIPAAGPML